MIMKVAFILFNNKERAPYLYYYTRIADKLNIDYDIILWDRFGRYDYNKNKEFVFKENIIDSKNKIKKIYPFFKYAAFVKEVLSSWNYNKVVVFTSQQSLLLGEFLIKNNIKYAIDIRDYSCEKIPGIKFILKRYIRKSEFTVISAPDFKKFLPQSNYILCHNIGSDNALRKNAIAGKTDVIKIAYVGGIGYYDEVSRFLLTIKNDSRFLFEFYGIGSAELNLKSFCSDNKIENCFFYGEYCPEDKDKILSKVHILYNCYGNSNNVVKFALSNKLYDAFKFGIPLLVSPNTSMESTAGFLGLPINTADSDNANKIYKWYHSINWVNFTKKSHEQYNNFLRENLIFENRFVEFLK